MKKIVQGIFVFALTLMAFNFVSLKADSWLDEPQPPLGVISEDTDFYSHWQANSFGAKRLSEKSILMALTSGYGQRAGHRTPYDISDFEAEFDLSKMSPGVVLVTFFGNQGGYISDNGANLSIDILKHTTVDGKYLVAVNKGSGTHNVSFPEFIKEEQGDWEDNAWKGYQIQTTNNIVKISFKKNDDKVSFKINDEEIIIDASAFYSDFEDITSTYFGIGTINNDNSIQLVKSNYVLDKSRREYYDDSGIYKTFEAKLSEFETLLTNDLAVEENVMNAYLSRNEVNLNLLYYFDKVFFSDRYNTASATLNSAIDALGGNFIMDVLSLQINDVKELVNQSTTSSKAKEAINALRDVTDFSKNISVEDLDETEKALYDSLILEIENLEVDLRAKVIVIVEGEINLFVNSVNELKDISDVSQALKNKNKIDYELIDLFEEEISNGYIAEINTANAKLEELTRNLDNWDLGNSTYVFKGEDSLGGTFAGESGMFYTKEKMDLRNFSISFDIKEITKNTGGWLSIGIMEKPEKFINKEDSSVQDNKGLFFLIVPTGQGKARVETYLMTLYANRFFDAQIQENFTIDITKTIDVNIKAELKVVSGVSDEYLNITIGGYTMKNLLTLRSLKTAISDYQGYLNIIGSGGSTDSMNSVKVNSINNFNPLSEKLSVEYEPEPLLETDKGTYEINSNKDLVIKYHNRNLAFELKLGSEKIDAKEYTFDSGSIVIKSDYLNKLEVGTHKITIISGKFTNIYDLTITKSDSKDPSSGLSTGAIIGIVGGVIVLSAGAFSVYYFRKKRK